MKMSLRGDTCRNPSAHFKFTIKQDWISCKKDMDLNHSHRPCHGWRWNFHHCHRWHQHRCISLTDSSVKIDAIEKLITYVYHLLLPHKQRRFRLIFLLRLHHILRWHPWIWTPHIMKLVCQSGNDPEKSTLFVIREINQSRRKSSLHERHWIGTCRQNFACMQGQVVLPSLLRIILAWWLPSCLWL